MIMLFLTILKHMNYSDSKLPFVLQTSSLIPDRCSLEPSCLSQPMDGHGAVQQLRSALGAETRVLNQL